MTPKEREESDYTFANGKVIGEFVCDKIFPIRVFENGTIKDYNCHAMDRSCVPYDYIVNYIGNGCMGYGWHISDLVIYDKPKELSEFSNGSSVLEFSNTKDGFPLKYSGMKRPPQSWCYVEKGGAE
jgi:hypothetical protein